MNHIKKRWLTTFIILFTIYWYLNTPINNVPISSYVNLHIKSEDDCIETTPTSNNMIKRVTTVTTKTVFIDYKYPLINSSVVTMDYNNEFNSSYYWFMSMKPLFKRIGPIKVNKTKLDIYWVEQQNPDVITGGYYAPAHCRPKYRVAIIVPYRDRWTNLVIFLHYIHPLLKKQLLEYRIFVIEQAGTEKFNKGTLYNIAFLETQRFGTWHCLIFHDVDLIPEDERISYSCPENPTHMSAAVEMFNYVVPYDAIFGGVTALTPAQYETVNGYSNCYWNWGGEDDDIRCRKLFLMLSRLRFHKEGLTTTKYKLFEQNEQKLFTYMLAEVNPTNLKLNTKSLMQHVVQFHGNSVEYDRQELHIRGISARSFRQWYKQQQRSTT